MKLITCNIRGCNTSIKKSEIKDSLDKQKKERQEAGHSNTALTEKLKNDENEAETA